MWTHNGEFRGLHLDRQDGILYWYDNLECQCTDENAYAEQTVAQFVEKGRPGGIGSLPADVQRELDQVLAVLGNPAAGLD